MILYEYKGNQYSVNELSEMSGISAATIRSRLRKGYSVVESMKMVATDESIIGFSDASWWEDFIGMTINDLHKIYLGWCVSNGYTPLQIQNFSRQLFQMYPNLKSIPNKVGNKTCRVIRER